MGVGHRGRVKDKIEENGMDTMFDYEFVEFILFGVIKRSNTHQIAQRLIKHFETLENLMLATSGQIMAVEGCGKETANMLAAYSYIFKRGMKFKVGTTALKNYSDIMKSVAPDFKKTDREILKIFLLNENNIIVDIATFTLNLVDKIEVNMTPVLESIAAKNPRTVLFAHNHPSGNANPSRKDEFFFEQYTKLLKEEMGVAVVEHLIFVIDKFYSYKNGKEIEVTGW